MIHVHAAHGKAALFSFLMLSVLAGTFPALALAGDSQAQAAEQKLTGKAYAIDRAPSPIKVDGALDEDAWAKAAVLDLPYEWLPGDNVPPPVKTDCLVTYDADFFYVAFRCYDPEPSKIRAHLMDRDATDTLIQDDHISFMVDAFNDERRGFQFRVNPLGVQADANFSELEGYEDFSWDAIWSSAGRIADWGYSIEVGIPFNQLRFPRSSGPQTWGFSAERSYPRNVRHRITSHVRSRSVTCIMCQFNKLTGFEGITPGMNLEVDPTFTANRTDARPGVIVGDMENGKVQADPGVTVRWGVTPNLILNATANPDFSQVEADVAQLEVNTRFALYYPEKRPFFLEGADFFLTPLMAVFTRTVADPAGGFKLTGKVGKNAFGFFGAYDRINNLLFPSNQGSSDYSSDDDVMSGVFRFRRDVGAGSTIGILYTGRSADDYHNHVGGVDGFFRLSQTKTLSFQYVHSDTRYPEATALAFGQKSGAFGGDAFQARFDHTGRDWMYSMQYKDLSTGFRADYGYIPRVDIRRVDGGLFKLFWGDRNDWYTRMFFGFEAGLVYDHSGNLTDSELMLGGIYAGPLQSQLQVMAGTLQERYQGVLHSLWQLLLMGEIKPAAGLRFGLQSIFGDGIDYYNARKSGQVVIAPSAEIGLGRHINLNLSHIYQQLRFEGSEVYRAHLPQVRLVYNFSVRAFVRAIVQYTDVKSNPALFVIPVPPKNEKIFTQLLFSYKLNPQTVLFIGYSDNYLGLEGIDLTQTDRTFFIKVGYAWLR